MQIYIVPKSWIKRPQMC